ncbi:MULTISPECIES: ABC transporter substrate-binding protein [unclassified Alsobacter]|jgi:branched-chain amino acid transport system substrate-binding protein|uniref:ABC transporter substrate-binding protein n=1 Tax=Alsobacter sp. KACC 23698 TaxID=3149229 RepID=A0AAU7JB42_9HYPH
MTISRRTFVQGAAGVALTGVAAPAVLAQSSDPIRVGLLTVKTGPLASGGIDMERALVMYLKERDNMLGGRKVELIVADTAGVPATARTKTQELVEKNNVHCIIGPLAAFEALAIDDYLRQAQMPTLSVAAAEDMTQRNPNPWFVRATSTSAQCAHPMGEYCAKELKYKRVITIADDIAYGHEMCGGFQRTFEENGGKIIQKLFPPLTAPDYGTYVAQLKNDADAIFLGFAGSNGFRFLRQFVEYGLKDKIQVVGGMTALDEGVLRNMGDEALGIITACWYSAELDAKPNQTFAPAFRKEFKYDPGFYAAGTYVDGAVLEAAVKAVNGKVEDKKAFMAALRATDVDTARGPVKFDEYGNVVGNVYLRKVTRKDGRLVNSVIKTYPNVSQFWTYDPKAFLANPVYSRDYPPAKNLEK